MTIDQAFAEVREEIEQHDGAITPAELTGMAEAPEELNALVEKYMPTSPLITESQLITDMTHAVVVAFESGRRYGRTQVLEELGMPKVGA